MTRLRLLAAISAAATMLAISSGAASASTPTIPTTVSVRAGTLGAGLEGDVRIPNSPFGIRAGVYGLNLDIDNLYHDNISVGEGAERQKVGLRYDASARLLNGLIAADWYPLRTGFRLSAGIDIDGNRLSGVGRPSGSIFLPRVGSVSGSTIGHVDLSAEPNSVAPYIGAGYSGAIGKSHFIFSADVGALFEGSLKARLSEFGPVTELPGSQAAFQKAQHDIQHHLNGYDVFPVAMVGIGYRF